MTALLLTQCVQDDFLRPLLPEEPLPNLVHVGRLEAARLCGPAGSLVPFLREAHAVDPAQLAIVHIADAHDPVRHAEHFALFREHCVAGSPGARLLGGVEELAAARGRTWRVPAGDLNDFADSPLPDVLAALVHDVEMRVGVVGVWTDVKVAFLLYELRTRLGLRNLATCSALTASRSLEAHFRGLESVRQTLGVEVFHSPASFLAWLAPQHERAPTAPARARLRFASPPPADAPDAAERLALLAGDTQGERVLTALGGGFSGAQVFLTEDGPGDARVVKVGARDEVARERFGNERVARVLGDAVPRLLAWREGTRLGAMEMELARSTEPGEEGPVTFKRAYEEDAGGARTALLCAALEEALFSVLGRFYRTAQKDNADLLETYGFTDAHRRCPFAPSIAARARAIAAEAGAVSVAALLRDDCGADGDWMDPVEFYLDWLPGRSLVREVFLGPVHGDLNLANILLAHRPGETRPARLWIIDFARLMRLPALTDFAKVENDLALLQFDGDAERARAFDRARVAAATLEWAPPVPQAGPEERHAAVITTLRRIAARLDPRGREAMDEHALALLRFAAHTLSFDEASAAQKRRALACCARLCARVAALARG